MRLLAMDYCLSLLLIVTLLKFVYAKDTCTDQHISAVRLSVNGAVNETGHRHIQADLRGNVPTGDDGQLMVDHWTEQCEDRQIVALNVTFQTITNTSVTNSTLHSSVPKITKGVNRRPRRLDYCLLTTGLGAYKVHEAARTWDEAKRSCEQENSHLAVIESKEEFDLLSDMLRRVGQSWSHVTVWIGVHRYNGSAIWKTILGRSLIHSSFLKWSSGWPSNYGDCAALRVYVYQKKIRYLCDPQCNVPLYYLCEQEL